MTFYGFACFFAYFQLINQSFYKFDKMDGGKNILKPENIKVLVTKRDIQEFKSHLYKVFT